MSLTTAQIENLRFHLGYGNITIGGYPYTPDGFIEIFRDVISPNLSSGAETTATTAVTAGSTTAVTPVAMTDIVAGARVVVDVGDDAEIVAVRSVTVSTFTAHFAKAHPASGYKVALLGGKARLELLLHEADKAWQAMTSADVGDTAGIKQADGGDLILFEGFAVLKDRHKHYMAVVGQLSRLVRVAVAGGMQSRSSAIEVY